MMFDTTHPLGAALTGFAVGAAVMTTAMTTKWISKNTDKFRGLVGAGKQFFNRKRAERELRDKLASTLCRFCLDTPPDEHDRFWFSPSPEERRLIETRLRRMVGSLRICLNFEDGWVNNVDSVLEQASVDSLAALRSGAFSVNYFVPIRHRQRMRNQFALMNQSAIRAQQQQTGIFSKMFTYWCLSACAAFDAERLSRTVVMAGELFNIIQAAQQHGKYHLIKFDPNSTLVLKGLQLMLYELVTEMRFTFVSNRGN